MMRRLFPQLPMHVAHALAAEYASATVEDLRGRASSNHALQVFSPTGGQQVARSELDELAGEVRALCIGEPSAKTDAELTRMVHRRVSISRFEAGLDGVWSFFGCVLLPDIVRWRFPGASTPNDRFIGTGRGVRSVLGRAWWRGELLFDDSPPPSRDSYWLVDELGEDEVTGIVERQRAVASRRVALALARALVTTDCRGVARSDVARDAIKVFLRLGFFVEFDALKDEELQVACRSLYRRSVITLQQARARPPA